MGGRNKWEGGINGGGINGREEYMGGRNKWEGGINGGGINGREE